VSGKAPGSTLSSVDAHVGFSACQKTEPHGTETAAFPQNHSKRTDLGQSETITTLVTAH